MKNKFHVCEHKLKNSVFPGFERPSHFLDIYFCPIFKRGFTFQQKYLIFLNNNILHLFFGHFFGHFYYYIFFTKI